MWIFIIVIFIFVCIIFLYLTFNNNKTFDNVKEKNKQPCLEINPISKSECYIGIVTEKSSVEHSFDNIYMSLLFGPKSDHEVHIWNGVHKLEPHKGCQLADTVNSPFIVDCDNIKLGNQLILKYYYEHFGISFS